MSGGERARGRLIVFEGIDGSGKSTQLEIAAQRLLGAGRDVFVTFEPTDGPAGRRLREHARGGEPLAPDEELALFLEDRREHVEREIAPALAAGRIVLCDRYTLSTVAYQGARGFDAEVLLEGAERDFPLPDRVLLFTIDVGRAIERIAARGQTEAAFEERAYLERVAAEFARIDRPYVVRVDGDRDPDVVASEVAALLAAGLLAD